MALQLSENQSAAHEQQDSHDERGGFHCKFVDHQEAENPNTKCPVCLLIIREPHQVMCCDKHFCKSCIEYIQYCNEPCPTCNTESFSNFPDNSLEQTLYGRDVYCSYKEDGCEWTGELGQLEAHLNKDPHPEKQLDGCQFAEIDCLYECGDQLQRQKIKTHQTEHCIKRPFSCEHCHDYKSDYDDVIHKHWPVCGSFPVHCPNECGLEFPRQKVGDHVDNDCPLTMLNCDFHHVGCTVTLPRKDMSEHLKENLLMHTSLLATSHAKQQAEIKGQQENISMQQTRITNLVEENEKLKSKNEKAEYNLNALTASFTILEAHSSNEIQMLRDDSAHLKKEIDILRREVSISRASRRSSIPVGPFVSPMNNFQQRKKNVEPWYSIPFYTHDQGYKLCLGVFANLPSGSLSVFIHFMKGEFDDSLKWPFRGAISFRLMDQVKGEDHRTYRVIYDESVEGHVCSRVTEKERAEKGRGKQRFIAHSELGTKYLQNNTLLFQIHMIEIA